MWNKVFVFAGTVEGREITSFLLEHEVEVYAFAATKYGAELLGEREHLTVSSERLTGEQMEMRIREEKPVLVVDATHPYAKEVTANIHAACERTQTEYVRLLRKATSGGEVIRVDSVEAAVEYLNSCEDKALLTTGSKELKAFTQVKDYKERLFARVLSLPEVAKECADLGFTGSHLYCMQGPFSVEMNEAILRQCQATLLVTKDTGEAGGFPEKYEAAQRAGAKLLVVDRPEDEAGLDPLACRKYLAKRIGFELVPKVYLVGIGTGSGGTLTQAARDVIDQAQVLLGAPRMVHSVAKPYHETVYEYRAQQIADYVKEHGEYERIAVILSGDVGFYSAASSIRKVLEVPAEMVCGVSSMVYFMSRLGRSWEGIRCVSMHGRDCQIIREILTNEKTFSLVGTPNDVGEVCRRLTEYGYGGVFVAVGENLSYENERIRFGPAEEMTDIVTDKLCVFYVENPRYRKEVSFGIPDEAFLRSKVPMTKEEVRTVSLSKLHLTKDSVLYDVGAGSGSVSVEAALCITNGTVYAIEKNPEAVELIGQNKVRFAADNLEVIEELAPEAMTELPAPTHAFLGGTSGNMREILELIFAKNPKCRVVVNAITLETVSEALECIRSFAVTDTDIVQMNVAKSKDVGPYHMMMGNNPVYIISFSGGER